MSKIATLILAAGKGTRMKSNLPKVLHPVAGLPMIHYPLSLCRVLKMHPIVLVVGKKNESIRQALKNNQNSLKLVVQDPPLGTADAVLVGMKPLKGFSGDILIMNGDMPLIRPETIRCLVETHRKKKAVFSLVTVLTDKPTSYGRIIRTSRGEISAVVEEKDASEEQKKINEINLGVYLVNAQFLLDNLKKVGSQNVQKEYYITDLVRFAFEGQKLVGTVTSEDSSEALGINSREDLTRINDLVYKNRIRELMASGVSFSSLDNVVIDASVSVGRGTMIYSPCHLFGKTNIGKDCVIEPGVIIRNSKIEDKVYIKAHSYIEESRISSKAQIGPFAHLRPHSDIGPEAKVGNFVEIKKSKIQQGSKVNHLSYVGDARIGKKVNIGAGTITCNYDGVHKHQTIIEDNVFVGSDTQFVAPVRIGKGAVIGAGSTITRNVKPGSLALSRTPQAEIQDYAKKRKKKKGKK